jgi:hypothetical protein
VPFSAVVTSANIHDVKVVTEVIGNTVVKRPIFHYFTKDNKKYTRGKYP